jgi:predicted DNA repair protein MutK
MTKVAAKKTAGVLGDDLALNAQQVSGVNAERELPVVWAVAKGSLINKAILVPTALLISAFIPWAVIPLLMLGGAFLCFEGFEKLAHKFLHPATEAEEHAELVDALNNPSMDMVAFEKDKIKGAIRTDFILSAEIIVITLGTVADVSFTQQVTVLVGIALIMTVGVYGLVAGIVKLDDGGLYLSRKAGLHWLQAAQRKLGHLILMAAPYMMKSLSVIGTAAMFMVGGSILVHGVPALHHLGQDVAAYVASGIAASWLAATMAFLLPILFDALIGIAAGALILLLITLGTKAWKAIRH